ncbi:hypothetical protein RclHR1_10250001 [Rhizophagus clarus]|uniref:Uncharacterized protein n=1 Tax=Rhizophagus clarus TaxID=94130 RepID=A0A2Z6Q137_9GLOM|nr:hypothetical protein RclHR1_10250001 [Rhizophagus clarus]GES87041.1 hypothetical protein GLOIN_2v1788017 [Rhizophagus clarus]
MFNSQAIAKSDRSITDLTIRTKTKIHCFCKECNEKLMNPRTKVSYKLKYNKLYANNIFSNNQKAKPSNVRPNVDNNYAMEYKPLLEMIPSNAKQSDAVDNKAMKCEPLLNIHELTKYKSLKRGKLSNLILENLIPDNERDMNNDQDRDFEDYDDKNRDSESYRDNNEDGVFRGSEDDEKYGDSKDFDDEMRKKSILCQKILTIINQNFLISSMIIMPGLSYEYYNINNNINFPMLQ